MAAGAVPVRGETGAEAMTKRMFELKADDLRAVIGGAIYYSAINRLPTTPRLDAVGKLSASPVGLDRPSVR
jgi:hypothetical protein